MDAVLSCHVVNGLQALLNLLQSRRIELKVGDIVTQEGEGLIHLYQGVFQHFPGLHEGLVQSLQGL